MNVCFDNEVASAPVVCHLGPVGFRPEEPGLVAQAVDLLVLGDASESLAPPAGVGVEGSHPLVGVGGAREDPGIEVGQFVGVLPLVACISEGDDVRRLPPELDVERVGGWGFCLRAPLLLRLLWLAPAGRYRPGSCDPRGVSGRECLLLLLASAAAANDDRRDDGDCAVSHGDRHDSRSSQERQASATPSNCVEGHSRTLAQGALLDSERTGLPAA
jgi:hypothetical protein